MTLRRTGRPAVVHDNRQVRAFLLQAVSDPEPAHPFHRSDAQDDDAPRWVKDILVGNTHLQTEGQKSTRPLSRHLLVRVLTRCDELSTESVAAALCRDYSPAAVARYTAHARAASKTIERQMDARLRRQHLDSRRELDDPFREDAQRAEALSLMPRI
jgi:hypothetical protein